MKQKVARTKIDRVVRKAIAYLAHAQKPDGSFDSLTAPSGTHLEDGVRRQTTFHASLVLAMLGQAKAFPEAKRVAQKAIRYLLLQKSSDWSWNYWKKGSPEHRSVRVPDDLDDTFAALSGINTWRPEVLEGAGILEATKHLITTETTVGGPYNTWIIQDFTGTSWEDIDTAVNANVMRFLKQKDISLPAMDRYFAKTIRKGVFASRYYAPHIVTYLLSHAISNDTHQLLKKVPMLFNKTNTVIDHIVHITTRLNLGESVSNMGAAIRKIIDKQKSDGSWEAAPFFTEQIIGGVPHLSGSAALSTGAAIEALTRYQSMLLQEKEEVARKNDTKEARRIAKLALERFKNTPVEFKAQAEKMIQKLALGDTRHEVALLTAWFAHAMPKCKLSKKEIDSLGTMNILGWTGYSIIDKVLDGENAIAMLPVANIAIREVSRIAESLVVASDQQIIRSILDEIDITNQWEHATCKLGQKNGKWILPASLPNYQNGQKLALKSIGHILGPLILLLRSSQKDRAKQIQNMRTFFEHYLAARQLNDDAHDWLEDLENGFINAASAPLLAARRKKMKRNIPLNLIKERESLQILFWEKIIDTVAADILAHTKNARHAVVKMQHLSDTSFIEDMLKPLEQAATKAIHERDSAQKLMTVYKS